MLKRIFSTCNDILPPEKIKKESEEFADFFLDRKKEDHLLDIDPPTGEFEDSDLEFSFNINNSKSKTNVEDNSESISSPRTEHILSNHSQTESSHTTTSCGKRLKHVPSQSELKSVKNESPSTPSASASSSSTNHLHSTQPYYPINQEQELNLLRILEPLKAKLHQNSQLCQFYNKLLVRKIERQKGMKLFDLDAHVNSILCPENTTLNLAQYDARTTTANENILDRFRSSCYGHAAFERSKSFYEKLTGLEFDQLTPILSPYSQRELAPYIWRDYESSSQQMKLIRDLSDYFRRKGSDNLIPVYPIDYCFLRPEHVPSINRLCEEHFWPDIDVSECLQYPDFTCVCLYNKLVIGFGLLYPEASVTEAYLSFVFVRPDWRNLGIASFILYHLIQVCPNKDISLHVSATNPAVLFYQRFGFQIEEFILDFYDKYYPDSSLCKHAVNMRIKHIS